MQVGIGQLSNKHTTDPAVSPRGQPRMDKAENGRRLISSSRAVKRAEELHTGALTRLRRLLTSSTYTWIEC